MAAPVHADRCETKQSLFPVISVHPWVPTSRLQSRGHKESDTTKQLNDDNYNPVQSSTIKLEIHQACCSLIAKVQILISLALMLSNSSLLWREKRATTFLPCCFELGEHPARLCSCRKTEMNTMSLSQQMVTSPSQWARMLRASLGKDRVNQKSWHSCENHISPLTFRYCAQSL